MVWDNVPAKWLGLGRPRTLSQGPWTIGMSARKKDQIDKKIFFKVINILDQMIKSTSILLRNFFLKKFSIWFLFPALTPYVLLCLSKNYVVYIISDFLGTQIINSILAFA